MVAYPTAPAWKSQPPSKS